MIKAKSLLVRPPSERSYEIVAAFPRLSASACLVLYSPAAAGPGPSRSRMRGATAAPMLPIPPSPEVPYFRWEEGASVWGPGTGLALPETLCSSCIRLDSTECTERSLRNSSLCGSWQNRNNFNFFTATLGLEVFLEASSGIFAVGETLCDLRKIAPV